MVRFLLDTNVISEVTFSKPNQAVIDQMQENRKAIAISSTVLHELIFGYERLPDSKRKDILGKYLKGNVINSIPVLSYDEQAARWHASERARLTNIGQTPAYADGQIASVAAANGLTLVTRNVSDFNTFQGLNIINWHE